MRYGNDKVKELSMSDDRITVDPEILAGKPVVRGHAYPRISHRESAGEWV